MYDIRPFMEGVKKNLLRHYLGKPGEYVQVVADLQQDAGTAFLTSGDTALKATPYGSAIAVNILYTINEMPESADERTKIINVLFHSYNGNSCGCVKAFRRKTVI